MELLEPREALKVYRPRKRRDRTTLMLQVLEELLLREPLEIYSRRGLMGKLGAKYEELKAVMEELRSLRLVRFVTLEDQEGAKRKGAQLTEEGRDLMHGCLPLAHRLGSRL